MLIPSIKRFLLPSQGSFKKNLIFAIVATLVTFLPDAVLNLLAGTRILFNFLFVLYTFGFMLLLSFCQNIFVYIILALFILMQTIQLNFIAFFGQPITQNEILSIFTEAEHVFKVKYLQQTWFVMPMIVLFYGTLLFVFYKTNKTSRKIAWMFVAVLYLMSHKPMHAWRETKGFNYFQPYASRASFVNSINTFSYFFFQYLSRSPSAFAIEYQPYKIEKIPSQVQNILVIFGESLASNHLPMFGYERNTFPLLNKRIKHHPNKVKTAECLACGVTTATSTALFFNMVREPANTKQLKSLQANMFKLAKENGFETYYLSSQESRLLVGLGERYIDHSLNKESDPAFYDQYLDEGLVLRLKDIDFSKGKKFVVLHMIAPHSPYEEHYLSKKEKFEKFLPTKSENRLEYSVNTYDNALLYTDFVINQILDEFEKQNKDQNHLTFITSDHGQLFDYHGLWGHNHLEAELGKVPAIIIGNNVPQLPKNISSYQLGEQILAALGYKISNPNLKEKSYYLHGGNIFFPYGFIKYHFDAHGNPIFHKKQNTQDLQKK